MGWSCEGPRAVLRARAQQPLDKCFLPMQASEMRCVQVGFHLYLGEMPPFEICVVRVYPWSLSLV